MRVDFDTYSYFDNKSKDKNVYNGNSAAYADRAFDSNKFNSLISKRQYKDAADYASSYHFKDPKKQADFMSSVNELKHKGRVLEAIYNKIGNPDDFKQVEFFDAAFMSGGLEQLETINKNSKDYNPYAAKFIELKNKLGNVDDENGGRQAKQISLTFSPKTTKRSLFGIDWLMPDIHNENNIEKFYENSGLTEQDLKNNNITVNHNSNGGVTLTFDKSNDLANTIIYNLPNETSRWGDYNPFNGFDEDVPVALTASDEKGEIEGIKNNTLYELQDLLSTAREYSDKAYQISDDEYKEYSSVIGPSLTDDMQQLYDALDSGQLTTTEFNRQAKAMNSKVYDAIYSLGSGAYEMYANYEDGETTESELLRPLSNEDRHNIINTISSYAPSQMRIQSMVSNGKIGTVITLLGIGDEDKKQENNGQRTQIFIPGLLQEEAQEAINKDTNVRAAQEANSMLDYNYNYDLPNGKQVVTSNGMFYIDNKQVDKNTAISEINKSMMLEDGISALTYQFSSAIGDITNKLNYEKAARQYAIGAISELYNNVKFNPRDGYVYDKFSNKYNPNDIFDRNIDAENTQYDTYDSFNQIYEFYNMLMSNLKYN